MVKRKITSYYSQSKRFKKNGVSLRRPATARATAPKNRSRKRVARRPRRRIKRRTIRNKVKVGNVKTYLAETADVGQVGTTTVGTGSDAFGQKCTWFTAGSSTPSTGIVSGTTQSLGGIPHIVAMADIIRNSEVDSGSIGKSGETKFNINSSSIFYQLINQANSVATIKAYYLTCTRDCINSLNAFDVRTILGDGFYQRAEITNSTITPVPVSGILNSQLNDPLLTVFDSHRFCQFFKCTKVQTMQLDPGQNKIIKLHSGAYSINYSHYTFFNSLTFYNGNPELSVLQYCHRKGETLVLFQVMGSPADFNNNNLTFTSPKIDLITKFHYNFASYDREQPIIYRSDAIGFSQAATAGTTASVMVDETGAVAQDTKA